MSKYDALKRRLEAVPEKTIEIELSIDEIELVMVRDGGLPPSLHRLDGWAWCNPGTTSSVQARAWTAAGFKVERLTQSGVVFKRL